MEKITGITQYNSDVGTLRFIHQKDRLIFSKFSPRGTRERDDWCRWFSKHQNSTGFLLEFIYK